MSPNKSELIGNDHLFRLTSRMGWSGCPLCGEKLLGFGFGAVCLSGACEMGAATLLDLVNGDRAALETAGIDAPCWLEDVSELLRIFRNLRRGEKFSTFGEIFTDEIGAWSMEASWTAAPVSSKAVGELLAALRDMGCKLLSCPALKTGGTVVPLWMAPGLLGGFAFYANKGSSAHLLTDVDVWAGAVDAARYPVPALAKSSLEAAARLRQGEGAAFFIPGAKPGWVFDCMQCLPETPEEFRLAARLSETGCTISIKDESGEGWQQEASDKIAKLVLSGKMLPREVAECGLGAVAMARAASLIAEKDPVLGQAALEATNNAPLFVSDSGQLFASPSGYRGVSRSGRTSRICDFCAVPVANVLFPNSQEPHRVFEVRSSSGEFWQAVASVDAAASFKTASAALSSPRGQILEIYDPPMYTKLVGGYLRASKDRLPVETGISELGWTENGSQFNGAGWSISSSGILSGARLYPSAPWYKLFRGQVDLSGEPPNASGINPGAAAIIELCCGIVCRAARGVPCRPVFVAQAPRREIAALFAGLGQTAPAVLEFRGRIEPASFGGHPFYGQGLNEAQASRSGLPVLLISDSGWRPPPLKNCADYASLFAHALAYVARAVLNGAQTTRRRADYAAALLAEGRAALAGYPGWPVVSDSYDAFEQLLERGVELHYDMTAQSVSFYVDEPFSVADVSAGLLTRQLRHDIEGRTIVLEAVQGLDAISAFYGEMPPLKRVSSEWPNPSASKNA